MNVIKSKPTIHEAWEYILSDHPLYEQYAGSNLKRSGWFTPILAYIWGTDAVANIKIYEKATISDIENIKDIGVKLEKLTGATVNVLLPWNQTEQNWYKRKEQEIEEILEGLE